MLWLSLGPLMLYQLARRRRRVVAVAIAATMLLAEAGRRRAGGRAVFPAATSLCAPLWVFERAVCAWFAVGAFLLWGGIPYRGRVIRRAATPLRILRRRTGQLSPYVHMVSSRQHHEIGNRNAETAIRRPNSAA
jgi:hypothetical protein